MEGTDYVLPATKRRSSEWRMASGEWGKGMGDHPISSYKDLHVWQDAMELAEQCYRLTATFPKDELFGLTYQVRRAAVSVRPHCGRTRQGEHWILRAVLRISQGSIKELETHLLLAVRLA